MATYLGLLALAHAQDPVRFVFRTEKYEFRDDVPAFDLLTGGAPVRERMLRGEPALEIARAAASVDADDRAIVEEAVEAGLALVQEPASAKFDSEPDEKSSTTSTSCPSTRSRSTRLDPMKPAPPVTSVRMP